MLFKCAEDANHVETANITYLDVHSCIDFLNYLDAPLDLPIEEYVRLAEFNKSNKNKLHDIAHQLIGNLIALWDANNPKLKDDFIINSNVIEQLRVKNAQCKIGHKHE